MDKVLLEFFANVLYIKGLLYADELNDIMNAQTSSDLDCIFEKMFNDQYSPYKKHGEGYIEIEVTKLREKRGE